MRQFHVDGTPIFSSLVPVLAVPSGAEFFVQGHYQRRTWRERLTLQPASLQRYRLTSRDGDRFTIEKAEGRACRTMI